MSSSHFNRSRIIAEMKDESCGIPTDVTFQIEEDGKLHEVKAHKMIVAMVSDTFKTMFFSTQVGDKNANIIKVEKTTAPAFRILMDAVYDVKSIGESLSGKSVDEVFKVVNLIKRYQIKELMEPAKDALEYAAIFEAEVHRKLEFATLLALMNDIKPKECSNCKKEVCRDGEVVKNDEFVEGLKVTNTRDSAFWGNVDYGTGRVTKVEAKLVAVDTIKAGGAGGFDGDRYPKDFNYVPSFLFHCN